MKVLLKIGYYSVIAMVLVVALMLFLPVLPIKGNIETKVVLSGSMEPSIRVGSIVVLKPSKTYDIGDTITFGKDTRTSIPTTHRIINSRIQDGVTYFQTKGDANPKPDNREVRESEIIGKILFSIPFLGYMIDFAQKPLGFALLIIIPGTIIVLDEVRKIIFEIMRMRRKKKE